MSKRILLALMVAIPVLVSAKDKISPLSEADAAALKGKTVAVTRHEKASFTAMTAGKATFALIGGAAMVVAGNKIVADNDIADPADVLERELIPAIVKQYGLQLREGPAPVIKVSKPKAVAASQADVDYVLDVESFGWMFAYFPTDWNSYWINYIGHVQLIERTSGKVVANGVCNTSTKPNPAPPTKEAMLDNNAQLLKDVTTGLGWTCTHLLAKEEFRLPDGVVTATPSEYTDPLATYAQKHGKGPAAAK
jgi:hypothetical protein